MTSSEPFFILGAPRSGTTMLRDLLRSVPGLYCPEETHFYRWAQPYRTSQFQNHYLKNKVIAHHQELDGISQQEVVDLLDRAHTRRQFMDWYIELFLEKQEAPAGSRWFDKTPQNVFGLPLLAHDYPESRFVHLYRNPLNVVASLKVGKVMSVSDTVAAANYWREPVVLAEAFRKSEPDRMISVSYETLTSSPAATFHEICTFVGIDTPPADGLSSLKPEANQFESVLDDEATMAVRSITESVVSENNYSFGKF